MRRTALAFALLLVSGAFAAPASDAYLKLRTQNHIHQAYGPAALDALRGTKVVEVQGTVRGTFRSGDVTSLMLERTDGETLVVETKSLPDWLVGNEVPVRVMVRVERPAAGAPLVASLMAAAPEADVAAAEVAYWRAEAAKRAAAAKPKVVKAKAANPLKGRIGRGVPASRKGGRGWTARMNEVTPIYAAFVRKRNPRLTVPQAMEIAQAVIHYSLSYGVEPRLIMAILMVESDFDPGSTSHSGAMGLGQLMPGTAAWMGVRNAYDTTENLYGTIKLIRKHLDQYIAQTGSESEGLVLALAAYNAGEGAVRRHGGVPPYRETQAYVTRVIQIYNRLCGGS